MPTREHELFVALRAMVDASREADLTALTMRIDKARQVFAEPAIRRYETETLSPRTQEGQRDATTE